MISYFKNLKASKVNRGMTHSINSGLRSETQARRGHPEYSRGMTYIELIVVLTIFSIITGISIHNYGLFQAKVDIKNLANDIALKVVQAQKDASFGKLPPYGSLGVNKPSYGLHFHPSVDNKSFVYFADLDASKVYNPGTLTCVPGGAEPECLEKINITKGNTISEIRVFLQGDSVGTIYDSFYMTFTRPGLEPTVVGAGLILSNVSYTQITITSPKNATAKVKVYASGRIQIN